MLKLTIVLSLLHFSAAIFPNNIVQLANVQHGQVDTSTITTSGLSSGGFMTTMMHYMYSSKIKGSGAYAGGPFGALYNISDRTILPAYIINAFSALPPLPTGRTAEFLEQQAITLSNQGLIDPITNLNGSKTYVFQGLADTINPPLLKYSDYVAEMGTYFGSDVKYNNTLFATHCTPTDNYGPACPLPTVNFAYDALSDCDYEGVFDMFSHFYGSAYNQPTSSSAPTTGTYSTFDQSAFTSTANPNDDFMNAYGGIYVPAACQTVNSTCKLHVAFHGCGQTIYSNLIGEVWGEHGGYFQAADANDIIVVFPRTAVFEVSLFPFKTNNGCWDWTGLTTLKPSLKDAPQVQSVAKILNAVIGSTVF